MNRTRDRTYFVIMADKCRVLTKQSHCTSWGYGVCAPEDAHPGSLSEIRRIKPGPVLILYAYITYVIPRVHTGTGLCRATP